MEPTCTTGGYDVYQCATCSAQIRKNEVGALSHSFTVKIDAKEANCTESGFTTYKCERCSATENRDTVAALGHTDADQDNTCDVCGQTISNSFGAKIKAFFMKIINFFKKFFKF